MTKPRFLRRHYPHQVQGVVRFFSDLSARRLPRTFFTGQNKTRLNEVNKARFCRASVSVSKAFGVHRNALQVTPRVSRKRPTSAENCSRNLSGGGCVCFFLYIGVEN